MKMSTYGWRRILALVVAIAMCCSLGITAHASGTSFVDVPTDAWYYEAVMKVTERGLFSGTDETHFSPDSTLTRAMFTTVMWSYAGKPSGYDNIFDDVTINDYYYNAVGWAHAQGLVSGISENLFGPHRNITREQMALMMYRFADSMDVELGEMAALDQYSDGTTVSAYAVDAVLWAVGKRLLRTDSGMIRPQADATRAEAAFMWAGFVDAYTNSGGAVNGKSAYELAVENGYTGTVQEWLASLVGADGASAYELAVKNGYEGTEVEWLRSLAGANGLSAYEIAVKNGYKGSEVEWLASLVGEAGAAGKDGVNGASAYELAVANGYKGTLEEWLLTLVGPTGAAGAAGKDGANGKSAYELAQEQGFKGTLAQWLDSLVGAAGKDGADGKDGVDGKSAYDLAVANGFNGSVTEWLASLVGAAGKDGATGAAGADGKSAYELAVANGYDGTVQQWLASLVGASGKDGQDGEDGKSAYELAVENGYKGTEAEWLESLKGEDGKDGADGISVVNAYINDQMHLILVMSDGTEIDAGYVGVEQEVETVTVTFIDHNGAVLKTEVIKKGGNATPPANPTREGYTFIGWSGSYTNVTADISVMAVYEENEPEIITYTVKFVDYDGRVLKTQSVMEGQSATAPAAPTREGYNFIGWDKNFANVTSDLTVTAMYEKIATETYVVTFIDYDGTVLDVQNVSAGADATPVVVPSKTGVDFLGWAGNYANVTKDETVRAVYDDEKNVILVHSASGKADGTVTVLVEVTGVVKTCGFDFDLFFDPALELASYDNDLDLDVVFNADAYENGVSLNFSSTNDKTKARDIVEMTFRINGSASGALPISIQMDSIKELSGNLIIDSDYVLVGGVITVE